MCITVLQKNAVTTAFGPYYCSGDGYFVCTKLFSIKDGILYPAYYHSSSCYIFEKNYIGVTVKPIIENQQRMVVKKSIKYIDISGTTNSWITSLKADTEVKLRCGIHVTGFGLHGNLLIESEWNCGAVLKYDKNHYSNNLPVIELPVLIKQNDIQVCGVSGNIVKKLFLIEPDRLPDLMEFVYQCVYNYFKKVWDKRQAFVLYEIDREYVSFDRYHKLYREIYNNIYYGQNITKEWRLP